jgi:hypothetical protein
MNWTRGHTQTALAALLLAGAGAWLAFNTEWVDVDVPPELRGPAKSDPLYTFKRFSATLGVELSTPDNLDRLPPPGATLVLSSWFWDMFPERTAALKRWVEAGGHLVLPTYEYYGPELAWTTIKSIPPRTLKAPRPASAASSSDDDDDDGEDEDEAMRKAQERDATPAARRPPTQRIGPPAVLPGAHAVACPKLREPADLPPAFGTHRDYTTCLSGASILQSGSTAQWGVDNSRGHLMLRVALGKGSVTAVNARLPVYGTTLLGNDDALLLTAALRMTRGQQLWLVVDEKRPPLLTTLWKNGAPAILLGALSLAFALWRAGVRFGPRLPATSSARRSVAEQIRGTAAFIAHHGGHALHRAQLRALDSCARSRVHGYDALIVGERAVVLAPLVGIDTHTLARAMNPELSKHLPSALALLETARRRLLLNPTNSSKAPDTA